VRGQYGIRVKAVTHRENPIFENSYFGKPGAEVDTLRGLNAGVSIYKQLSKSIPEITAVNVIQNGLTYILAAHNPPQGFADQVAMIMASPPWGRNYYKNIILVDDNVDPFDLSQVMWVLSTKVRPEIDSKVIPGVSGMPCNPITQSLGINDKMIIDTTTKSRTLNRLPQEVPSPGATGKSGEWKLILDTLPQQLKRSDEEAKEHEVCPLSGRYGFQGSCRA
jgi:UbiD family decarboxylase